MKSLFFFVLISASLLMAQSNSADSSTAVQAQGSVSLSDLVKQQINIAKEKQSVQTTPVVNVTAKEEVIQPVNEEKPGFLASRPLHVKIFLAGSIVILFAFSFRRTLLALKKRSTLTLKNKIALLREEKVIAKTNPKLENARKKLRDNKSIFDVSEKHISKVAKELNVAKGELLLASRIKLFEIGKI